MHPIRSRSRSLLHALALVVGLGGFASAADAGWHLMRADLFGPEAADGKVVYRERPRNGDLERRFFAKVEDAVPGTDFAVWIGDYFVGTMTANDLGVARIALRTPQHIDSPGDGDPMPADFPTPISSDFTVVGGQSGFFYSRDDDDHDSAQRVRLRGDLAGPTSMDGQVRWLERFKRGRLLRRFKVSVEDGDLGAEYAIRLNGDVVAFMTITDEDETEFELRTPEFIDDPGDGEPMPDDFPSLLPGDVVTVGPLETTLETH